MDCTMRRAEKLRGEGDRVSERPGRGGGVETGRKSRKQKQTKVRRDGLKDKIDETRRT
jgi:hypothetical protein